MDDQMIMRRPLVTKQQSLAYSGLMLDALPPFLNLCLLKAGKSPLVSAAENVPPRSSKP